MVDNDIDNLMWELEADADSEALPDELRDACEDLIETAQEFLDLTKYEVDEEGHEAYTTVGNCFALMRKTRDIASDLRYARCRP